MCHASRGGKTGVVINFDGVRKTGSRFGHWRYEGITPQLHGARTWGLARALLRSRVAQLHLAQRKECHWVKRCQKDQVQKHQVSRIVQGP